MPLSYHAVKKLAFVTLINRCSTFYRVLAFFTAVCVQAGDKYDAFEQDKRLRGKTYVRPEFMIMTDFLCSSKYVQALYLLEHKPFATS